MLQWGHGLITVVNCRIAAIFGPTFMTLQWGHGLITVVRGATGDMLIAAGELQWGHGLITVVNRPCPAFANADRLQACFNGATV